MILSPLHLVVNWPVFTVCSCKVELRNMDTGDLAVFHVDAWLSKTKDDRQLFRDVAATVRGKSALKRKLHRVPFSGFLADRL